MRSDRKAHTTHARARVRIDRYMRWELALGSLRRNRGGSEKKKRKKEKKKNKRGEDCNVFLDKIGIIVVVLGK